MSIGILTFHWGTNYGAILQAYCLQEYLKQDGYQVDIINYKPSQYNFSWLRMIRHPSLWRTLHRALTARKKEILLISFREKFLNMTRRYCSIGEFKYDMDKYDVLISGSDQVLNSGFTMHGENGKPSPAYWLGFNPEKSIRIGYAVSFGCENYPEDAAKMARQWVNGFDAIGTREQTGQQILDNLGYKGHKSTVPDPTLLLGKDLFENVGIVVPEKRESYICVYMLRHEIEIPGNVRYIDEKHDPLSMEQWLEAIVNAKGLITNSYHGTIMALLAHVPFAVLLETGSGSGMNDRFHTLLVELGLESRMTTTIKSALCLLDKSVDWIAVDKAIQDYKDIGVKFLKMSIGNN